MLVPGSFASGEAVGLPSSNISGLVRPWSHSSSHSPTSVRNRSARTTEDG
jgi:hypothetical protein